MGRLSHLAESVLNGEPEVSPPPIIKRTQVQRRLKPDEVDELVAKYESGMTVKQLAEDFKINRGTVMDHLRRRGVQTRRIARKLSDVQIQRVIELYATGISLAEIGTTFDVNAETVRRELVRLGVPRRPPGRSVSANAGCPRLRA